MIKYKILVVLLVEIIVFCFMCCNQKNIYNNQTKVINLGLENDVNLDVLDNYVIGVVAAEMPATFSFEALKAQSVAARTFSYRKIIENNISYKDLKSDQGQSYYSIVELKNRWKENYDKYYKRICDAVLSTKGEIITYDGYPIKAYYFSTSNGYTENSISVFKEEPYLLSVSSDWDKESSGYISNLKITKNTFKEKLGIDNNADITISNIRRSQTNHVDAITINGKNYTGIEIRKLLGLRSTDFEINDNGNNELIINTKGYGHGVGMSQTGANYLANAGKTYKEILKYYYTNVELSTI